MTTQEKIDQIIKDQYGDFKGRKMQWLKTVHYHMRYKPLSMWQVFLYVHGFKITLKKRMTDEKYLEFLEKSVKENPRPVYQIPEQLKK